MAWSVNDLSIITELLIGQLNTAIQNSAIYQTQNFSYDVYGLAPDSSRRDGRNVLTLYLLHVSRDSSWRNTPVSGSRAQLVSSQPLSLNLSYLLTSFAEQNWMLEQQLMSIALSWFHANPICRTATAEFTVSVEYDSIEEMSRLWQAITVPIRLSAMFRVAVIFLTPPVAPVADSRAPVQVSVSVAPDLNSPAPPALPAVEPVLNRIWTQYVWIVPPSAVLDQVTVSPQPAVVTAGGNVWVRGTGLNVADAAAVFLSLPGGPEWQLDPATNPPWIASGDSASGSSTAANDLHLAMPASYGPLPAGTLLATTPTPGIYQLAVGNPSSAFRSNALQLAIAPTVTGIGNLPPVLAPDGTGTYTISVAGLVLGQTQLLLDTTALSIGAAAGAGIAVVTLGADPSDPTAGTIAWMLASPSGFASGSYVRVRVIVNGVEAAPGWWVPIP